MRTGALKYRTILSTAGVLMLSVFAVVVCTQLWSGERSSDILDTSRMTRAVQPGEERLGGAGTVTDSAVTAYGRAVGNVIPTRWEDFYAGKLPFLREWDAMADGSTPPLGPFFSALSCESCHQHDGRGRPPASPHEISESMIVRFSVQDERGNWVPDPVYGEQLDMYGVKGTKGEGIIRVAYDEVTGEYADGSSYTLLEPEYSFEHLAYGDLGSDVRFSPRVAPANFGLGLLEAISEEHIYNNADPYDHNRDGISGRVNIVRHRKEGRTAMGRFGWKANQPTIEQQTAKAFHADLGITSSLYPEESQLHTPSVRPVRTGAEGVPELSEEDFRRIVIYVRLLAVPRQRNAGHPEVRRGGAIFNGIGCAGCHIPEFRTSEQPEFPELGNQVIHPYTDLLLHDMGEGLADGRPEGVAEGNEWRTPPLWGIGLVKKVSGHTRFLHDGRARNIEEAILWHGGEAAGSQELYRRLAKKDRSALLAFLESL